jgi:hypothetical protein
MVTLIASRDVMQVDRLGTSMGGLIGMLMAVVPGNPIRHMLVNGVGPYVPKAALERIDRYLSCVFFGDMWHAERHALDVYNTFGNFDWAVIGAFNTIYYAWV